MLEKAGKGCEAKAEPFVGAAVPNASPSAAPWKRVWEEVDTNATGDWAG